MALAASKFTMIVLWSKFVRCKTVGTAVAALMMVLLCGAVAPLWAQEGPQGPITPLPDHEVKRISNNPEPEAPPDLPPAEIIKRFAQKEDQYLQVRGRFAYRKTIRIDEFGPDGQPAGQFLLVTEPKLATDGHVFEKVVEKPPSTLRYLDLVPGDIESLARIPAYPITTAQLAKYDLKYIGTEKVDEIDCYIFQVKPKIVERKKAYFEGVVWVDAKYIEVVKTYGKWITDLGDVRSNTLPFTLFETYRENVEGKYWLPNYSRSDDALHLKDEDVPVRLVIKWTDFKPLAAAPPAPSGATPAPETPAASKP